VQINALGTNAPGEILAGYAAEVGFPMSTPKLGYAR
jgi:hypothetical protein